MTVLLDQHAREAGVGRVCVSPIDVVLDEPRALVVQPDVVFVSHRRASIIREQIWGAPDLVVEVLSPGTRRRDRTSKVRWYRRYRVGEYWMVDPTMKTITIVTFPEKGRVRRRTFRGARAVASAVLPAFDAPASAFFDSYPRGFAPRTPRHALSRAAAPARSVRVARSRARSRRRSAGF